MNFGVGSVPAKPVLTLLLANLTEASQVGQAFSDVCLHVVIEQDVGRLLGLSCLSSGHRPVGSVCAIARRERVVAVTVLPGDRAVSRVNDHIHSLIAGHTPGQLDGLDLRSNDPAGSLAAIPPDGPFSAVWNDVLVLCHAHDSES